MISAASENIEGAVVRTPLQYARTLSNITGAECYLKFEIFQFTSAYKERGALNRLLALPAGTKGVVAMSAGNHAQGVSYHASRLGIPATIVMPFGTPFNKIKRSEELGARVVISGKSVEEARQAARRMAEEEGLTFIHPFDDPLVIAGQGTVAKEMLEDCPDLDTIVVPIGGGGLIAGMARWAKHIRPDIRITGVQAEAFPSMKRAIKGGDEPVGGTTIAEGIAVYEPGEITQQIVRDYVDDILVVPEAATESAIVSLMEIEKVIVEGAGATSLAAIQYFPEMFKGQKVGLVLTGGNIDSRMLASAIMRVMARDGRISRLNITLLDQPGSLADVTAIVAHIGGNVLEIKHQREFGAASLKMSDMELVVETKDRDHAERLISALEEKGYRVAQLPVG